MATGQVLDPCHVFNVFNGIVSVFYGLPNKVHYLINLKEHEELNRQVMVLVEILKGCIRENMTPCVVPTILMQKKDGT